MVAVKRASANGSVVDRICEIVAAECDRQLKQANGIAGMTECAGSFFRAAPFRHGVHKKIGRPKAPERCYRGGID